MYKVMLADDEPIMRKALEALTDWNRLGCEVVFTAVNGKEVLENLETVRPDILVTDIRMPGADGIEIAKDIFRRGLPVKVIILTAYADFSYAQSALKYNVVDYVTKTGMLDGLEAAVLKCGSLIEKERKPAGGAAIEEVKENFFRAVFDGSLYDGAEILDKCRTLEITASGCMVLLFHYPADEEKNDREKMQGSRKFRDFCSTVFADCLIKDMSVQKDIYCIILETDGSDGETVLKKCGQVLEMADKLAGFPVCTGASESGLSLEKLKEAYDQAVFALEYYFLDGGTRLRDYGTIKNRREKELPGACGYMEEVIKQVQNGNGAEAKKAFETLLGIQKETGMSAASIKSAGMMLQERCRRILSDNSDTLISETGHSGGIAKQIYGTLLQSEYTEMMERILEHTAEGAAGGRGRRNSLIADCERYIEEHYAQDIPVAVIAREIGTNASYLSRIFKEHTGNTVIATINGKKLQKAKEYLLGTDMKIYEIAAALGFENTTYFSHFFKKYTGQSPKEFGNREA